jgi:hypothetical protein
MRIVSGGQTGVDRAALDVAIAKAIPYSGGSPRGIYAKTGEFILRIGDFTPHPAIRSAPRRGS